MRCAPRSPKSVPAIRFPLRSLDDRRAAERFDAAMPVRVDGREGTTNDLSATGLSFESEQRYEPGERIEVVIEYLLDGHNYPLRCEAEVVRCQAHGARFLVGARLLSPVAEGPYDVLS